MVSAGRERDVTAGRFHFLRGKHAKHHGRALLRVLLAVLFSFGIDVCESSDNHPRGVQFPFSRRGFGSAAVKDALYTFGGSDGEEHQQRMRERVCVHPV